MRISDWSSDVCSSDLQDRLRMSYATDPVLARRFADLAENHLEIVVGDVAEPRLGLDAKGFDSLAGRVDHIVHCGALVNHMLSYPDLFGPKVAGIAPLDRKSTRLNSSP